MRPVSLSLMGCPNNGLLAVDGDSKCTTSRPWIINTESLHLGKAEQPCLRRTKALYYLWHHGHSVRSFQQCICYGQARRRLQSLGTDVPGFPTSRVEEQGAMRFCQCTLKLASTSAPSKSGTDTAVTSAWVIAAFTFSGAGGCMCSMPVTSTSGDLHNMPYLSSTTCLTLVCLTFDIVLSYFRRLNVRCSVGDAQKMSAWQDTTCVTHT